MRLSVAWWNTSIAPTMRPNRAQRQDVKIFARMIDLMLAQMNYDLLCLGEVSPHIIAILRNRLRPYGLSIYEPNPDSLISAPHLAAIVRDDKLQLVEETKHLAIVDDRATYRTGWKLHFAMPDGLTLLQVFVVHWPSRLYGDQNGLDRNKLGMRLNDEITRVRTSDKEDCIIVMGDFNDEPFDHSVARYLQTSRDRHVVAKDGRYLYNPFWRHLGHRTPYSLGGDNAVSPSGTCYYASDRAARWKTFDQMLFSSGFFGHSPWHLDEKTVQVLDVGLYTPYVTSSTTKFDHLPISATLVREETNGRL
jgi:hypothetical protein